MKTKIILILIWISSYSIGQIIPNAGGQGTNSIEYWSRSGNNQGGSNNNIFGTKWNSPIYTVTGGITPANLRMKLNGIMDNIIQYPINGYGWAQGVNTSGYQLLGRSNNSLSTGLNIYNQMGAYSLLHLNGEGSVVQEYGYKPWMKTGITFTGNRDLSYFGLRKLSTTITQEDLTETVLLWSDNPAGAEGPDHLVFRFSGFGGNDGGSVNSNRLSNTDLDGLHVAEFTGTGLLGLGNTFGTDATGMAAALYNTPRSLLHMSYDYRPGIPNMKYGFGQITYRKDLLPIIGTGETESDGLRWGIDNLVFNSPGGQDHLNGYLRWQENSSFIIQSDWDNVTGGTFNGERIRVTSVGSLVSNQGLPYLGITLPANTTRIAISHNGATPVTRPMSLVHLGYNTGLNSPIATADGWRSWMDIGTFTSNGTDHTYVGLKSEGADRADAVINWGDNQVAGINPNGPDKLRFIFTSTTTALPPGAGDSVSQSQNGLETMRIVPFKDTTYTDTDSLTTYGRVGIGDFTVQGVNEEPTHKLDVVGNGRFRFLPDSLYFADSTVNKYVMVDSLGVLRWSSASPGFGAACGDTVNGKLQFDTQVDLNNYNLYFTRNDSISKNLLAIGYNCGDSLDAKLNVYSDRELWSGSFFVNDAYPDSLLQQSFQGGIKSVIDSTKSESANAIYGYVAPNLQSEMLSQVGVKGEVDARMAKEAIGVFGVATIQDPTGGAIGGRFLSSGSGFGRAVQAQNITSETFSGPGTGFGFGGDFSCYNPLGTSVGSNTGVVGSADGKAQRNIGVLGRATGNGIFNCGVYGEASGGVSNYAAYFQGNVYVNGGATSGSGYLIASDQQFKNEINNFSNGLEILEEIAPKTYYLDTNNNFGINFPSTLQYGMIAQDVEQVLPSLVAEVTKPASYDSLGNVLTQEITYKSLNYNAFIPILISAVKEQNEKIDVQDEKIDSLNTVVDDLNNRLTQLENCLSGILPFLCQMSNSSIQQTPEMVQEQIRTAINVNLSDKNTIVLNQNVPNPFAESTVITYSIPATVVKAQIHFYDGQGKLINSVEITSRGAGQLNVFGEDLSSGTYTYTLVADGQIVSTKKMVKE